MRGGYISRRDYIRGALVMLAWAEASHVGRLMLERREWRWATPRARAWLQF